MAVVTKLFVSRTHSLSILDLNGTNFRFRQLDGKGEELDRFEIKIYSATNQGPRYHPGPLDMSGGSAAVMFWGESGSMASQCRESCV